MDAAFDIVVVGAGMVGATIACGLARSGLKVAIVDPAAPPPYVESEAPHIRVSAISFASEQVLRHVGAWAHIETKRICPYRRLAVNEMPVEKGLASLLPNISTWAKTEFDAQSIGKTHLGHIIENDVIQGGLHEAMKTCDQLSVFCPDTLVDMNLAGEQKNLKLLTQGNITASLVIGADGAQSKVRETADIGQYREQYAQQAFVCTVAYRGAQEDITWQSFTSHGPMAFLPLADSGHEHFASLVWYDLPDQTKKLCELDAPALLKTLQRCYPPNLPPLERIVDRARFPLYKSHALRYVKPGIALAGDAAHTINPLAGQGVNLGFMDAAALIETLAQAAMTGKNIASLKVLTQYERSRRFENQAMMSLMDAFYYGFSNDRLPLRILRNAGLGLANHSGFVKDKVMQYAIGAKGKLPKLAKPV